MISVILFLQNLWPKAAPILPYTRFIWFGGGGGGGPRHTASFQPFSPPEAEPPQRLVRKAKARVPGPGHAPRRRPGARRPRGPQRPRGVPPGARTPTHPQCVPQPVWQTVRRVGPYANWRIIPPPDVTVSPIPTLPQGGEAWDLRCSPPPPGHPPGPAAQRRRHQPRDRRLLRHHGRLPGP